MAQHVKSRALKPAELRWLALITLLPMAVLGAVVLTVPEAKVVISAGPIQHGHADVDCAGCHVSSAGSLRQQAQANVKYALGLRNHPVDFGYAKVTSDTCLDCHERPNERHPIYRFNEPRFLEARETVEATTCLGCHSEHAAERSFIEPTFCVACHEDLELKNDPVDVPHVTLIADARWDTCMGCHDFHGNHPVEPQVTLATAYAPEDIIDYLADGPSPFGDKKIYEAKE
ncbi:MAG: cytochrome c3 family protein [Pseudomonadota bacterium]